MPPAAPGSESAFSLAGVSCALGGVRAIDDVDVSFPRGEASVLIGTSGSGKSTVLRLLLGLEWPSAGTVYHAGEPLRAEALRIVRREIGYVIQDGGLFPHLTVLGNLALLPRHLGWTRAHVLARARELAAFTHLHEDLLGRFPNELSGGQRQRVALMRALMLDPPTLLLDEPLGALDPLARHDLQEDLREIFRRLGKTVVLVTHDLAEAAFFGRHLILMRQGRVVQEGSLDDFRHAPADPFVSAFIAARRELPERAT